MKLKKVLLVGGIAALGLALVGGFGVVKKQISYAKQSVQAWMDENTDPEQEIKRLKGEVAKLDGEEEAIKRDLSKEIAKSEKLAKDTAALQTAVDNERKDVLAFGDLVRDAEGNKDGKKVTVGKNSMNVDDAKRKLTADAKNVTKREKMLGDMQTALKVREEGKAVLYAQLAEIQDLRRSLSTELDAIETEYKSLKLQGMKSKYQRDDSKLSEVRQDIEKLRGMLAEQRAFNDLSNGKSSKAEGESLGSVDDILAPLNGGK
jgi:chromosome segregation ATPase